MRTAIFAGVALLGSAGGALAAPEVEIEDAVARVTVIPENRSDIQVEVVQGSAGLPIVTVERRGDKVFVDGHLKGREIGDCSGGDGRAMVTVRKVGRIDIERQAPRVTVRTPMDVDVEASGAVFGNIGRARSVELSNAGCGDWRISNVQGELDVSSAGSGSTLAGTAGRAELRMAGSGDARVVSVRNGLDVKIAGSGDVRVREVRGPLEISVAGSGNVVVEGGRAAEAKVEIAGSGDVQFDGEAASLNASIAGSGDVRFQRVSGPVNRRIIGSGEVRVGR